MRTDERLDDELDRAVRDLLPPMPRSPAWERNQRDRLLDYIVNDPNRVPASREAGSVEHTDVDTIVDLSSGGNGRLVHRQWRWIGAAAAAALVVGALVVAQQAGDPAAPETRPLDTAPAFLEATGRFPIDDVRVDAAGEVTFVVGDLPEGYEVVMASSRLRRGSTDAYTEVPDDGDGIAVWVDVHNPLAVDATLGDLQRVDVNGTSGWLADRGRGSSVTWPVSATTWATVGGASSADAALEFARALTFVDEATWATRYNVPPVQFAAREDELTPADAPASTRLEPVGS